jgi:hypothetical protein
LLNRFISRSLEKSIRLTLQKALPIITSIVIILIVAVLRERSRTLAAIFGTMPINMPLVMWIIWSTPDTTQPIMIGFVRSLIVGMIPTMLWLAIVFLALRSGWQLWTALFSGYAVWGVLLAVAIQAGFLRINQ